MAGHSKWANIKHRKARQDASRGKVWTKVIREITVAAKDGPDPNDNPRLRLALEKANAANMPKDTIKRAIEKGSGTGETGQLEEIVFEGYGPGGVAILVETMTDNRNRTVSDVRHAFSKNGGNLGSDGSVSFLFRHCCQFIVESGKDEDEILDIALEAGADDVIFIENGPIEVLGDPKNFSNIHESLVSNELKLLFAEVTMRAKTIIKLEPSQHKRVQKLIDEIDAIEDVQSVFFNSDLEEHTEEL